LSRATGSKFTAYTRNVKAQLSKKSISGSKCKQEARLALVTDIPENIRSTIHMNWGFEIFLNLFFKDSNSQNPK
jgi:hypothetical protein